MAGTSARGTPLARCALPTGALDAQEIEHSGASHQRRAHIPVRPRLRTIRCCERQTSYKDLTAATNHSVTVAYAVKHQTDIRNAKLNQPQGATECRLTRRSSRAQSTHVRWGKIGTRHGCRCEAAVVEPVWLPLCNDTLLFPRSSSYRYHAVHTKARRHTPGFDCSHAG